MVMYQDRIVRNACLECFTLFFHSIHAETLQCVKCDDTIKFAQLYWPSIFTVIAFTIKSA